MFILAQTRPILKLKTKRVVQFCMQNHCDPEDCFLQTSHFQSATPPFNFFLLFANCKDLTRIIFSDLIRKQNLASFTEFNIIFGRDKCCKCSVTEVIHCIHPEWRYPGKWCNPGN